MGQAEVCDVLIIGSGAAGLSLALTLAASRRVVVLSKAEASESATMYAQGGVSAVMDHADSVESHIEDTLIAGAGQQRTMIDVETLESVFHELAVVHSSGVAA